MLPDHEQFVNKESRHCTLGKNRGRCVAVVNRQAVSKRMDTATRPLVLVVYLFRAVIKRFGLMISEDAGCRVVFGMTRHDWRR